MQLGFVIDQTRCIGCHACTVACKSENHVPVGNFRTWVKYTEEGSFPTVKRSFSVLRCNQCSAAPCVTICPVNALEKRPDGIVDVDPAACIGCKACMHGCPYDALYLNESSGTAEKCHFCAHRTERGLAPACAVVCPTEAIIPGDFDDPDSLVSRLRREQGLTARKPEAGTGPNVLYREGAAAGLDPLATTSAGGHLWSDRMPSIQPDVAAMEALEARARTTYDVPHAPLWGSRITGYLLAKSLAAGVALAALAAGLSPFAAGEARGGLVGAFLPLLAMAFLGATLLLLVLDLKRPERFLFLLTRGNPSSWLVKGTWILTAFGVLLVTWTGLGLFAAELPALALLPLQVCTAAAAALSAAYTGWLFAQAKGRVLWMRRWLWFHLIVQALVAGGALLAPLAAVLRIAESPARDLVDVFFYGLVLHLILTLAEEGLAPPKRKAEYARAVALVTRGPWARMHWILGVGLGTVVPLALLAWGTPLALVAAGVLALVGLLVEEHVLVRAGQALPIS